MLEIDGSRGGGQLLRVALGLATITKTGFRMENIRGNRDNPGLKEQHLQGVNTITAICNATVDGAEKGSETLTYTPGDITDHNVSTRIRTAGSVGLLFQTLMLLPATLEKQLTVQVNGGATFGKWAPTIYYLQEVLLPFLNRSGYTADIAVERHGFYPVGNAKTMFTFQPWTPQPFTFEKRGDMERFTVKSLATTELRDADVAERQADAAADTVRDRYPDTPVEKQVQYCDADCPGTGILTAAHTEGTVLGGDAVGEKGVPAEKVGRTAATTLVEDAATEAGVDRYAADQLIPFLALAGGQIQIPRKTDHVETVTNLLSVFDVTVTVSGGMLNVQPLQRGE